MIYVGLLLCGLFWWHGFSLGRVDGSRRVSDVAARAYQAGRREEREDNAREALR